MRKPPTLQPLGELETSLMRVVWEHPSVTAREVCDRLTGRRERAYTTVMTTLDRLHRKGVLLREKDGLAWRYRARLTRAEFERAIADQLAIKILADHGDTALSAFVDAVQEQDEVLLEKLAGLVASRRSAKR